MILEYSAFLHPEILQDTPRLFTALAEWLAVFVYLFIYKRKYTGRTFVILSAVSLAVLVLFQFAAGLFPIFMWVPSMILAVCLMYGILYTILDVKPRDCGVLVVHAFVLAEFAASLYKQLYVWCVGTGLKDSTGVSFLVMLLIYGIVYVLYYTVEKGNIPSDLDLNITAGELFSVVVTGIVVFAMSNISFVTTKTPFSAEGGLLYVRTLVDFGGMLMLMTQMGRRNELAMRQEHDAINQLFQRQYEQYRLAIDNSEGLRKEMHDMKHYVHALKNEDDPKKRAAVLEDMEQAIAVQEAFMNTGNKVLDVILTTKSLHCQKSGIILHAMVDGEALSNVHVKDICSLFGNVLDNAIEAVQMVEQPENRLINLSVRNKNRFIVVECENYSNNQNVRLEEHSWRPFQSVLLKTTKKDTVHHGFGLKSIGQVAEKYNGAMNVSYEKGWFKVKVILPVVPG